MLTGIRIARYRGIREGEVDGFGRVNLFVGPNGSGKSTLLEAIFLGASGFPLFTFSPLSGGSLPLLALRHGESSFPTAEIWYGKDSRQPIEIEYRIAGASSRTVVAVPSLREGVLSAGCNNPFFERLRFLDVRVLLDASVEHRAWNDVLNGRFDKELVRTLNRVYSFSLEGFSYTPQTNALKALFSDRSYALSVDDLGAGMRIAFRLFISVLLARESAVLVEEFDGYQHVETLPRFVQALLSLAAQVRCQLFLATHSLETVRAFVAEARKQSSPADLKVFQTALSADGKFRAAALSEEDADTLLRGGFDLRRTA